MQFSTILAFTFVCHFSTACTSTNASTIKARSGDCPAVAAVTLNALAGDWTLSINADEGWTGFGESKIRWDEGRKCSLIETANSVFNQESETPFENRSSAILIVDELSDVMKLLVDDGRGFVHLGESSGLDSLDFEILRRGGNPTTRRIQYRSFEADSFVWAWQGHGIESGEWEDRLVITYSRKSDHE
ncbi:MAG: hypothetical protein AAF216_09155 [Pseudomonadota bacterium]